MLAFVVTIRLLRGITLVPVIASLHILLDCVLNLMIR